MQTAAEATRNDLVESFSGRFVLLNAGKLITSPLADKREDFVGVFCPPAPPAADIGRGGIGAWIPSIWC
jgi:hypothetical protein